jgi:hypothetical protein
MMLTHSIGFEAWTLRTSVKQKRSTQVSDGSNDLEAPTYSPEQSICEPVHG